MWFVDGDVDDTPGTTNALALIVVNVGEETETFRLSAAGLPAPWTTIHPATITVLAGSQEEVSVEVHPPRLPSSAAGPTVMTVRASAQDRADVAGETTIALTVSPVQDRRLTLLQPAQHARRRATFEMTLENRGNTHASCRMRLLDPSGRVEGDFDPPAVGVDPGATALVRVRVRATERRWERRSRSLAFRVEAEQQGVPPATDAGSLVQLPVLPERVLGGLIALLIVAALVVAGWFGIVRPAIRHAANAAVRDHIAGSQAAGPTTASSTTTAAPLISVGALPPASDSAAPSTSTIPGDATSTTTTSGPATSAAQGAATSQLLTVQAPPGQTQTATYVVPAGDILRVTDLVLQNPGFDKGEATLSRNDQVLLSWGIDTMLFVPNAFVTPIEVAAGDQLVFTLTCTAVGAGANTTTGTCSVALLVSGRIGPAS
jgi:hypothetical protein